MKIMIVFERGSTNIKTCSHSYKEFILEVQWMVCKKASRSMNYLFLHYSLFEIVGIQFLISWVLLLSVFGIFAFWLGRCVLEDSISVLHLFHLCLMMCIWLERNSWVELVQPSTFGDYDFLGKFFSVFLNALSPNPYLGFYLFSSA